ncbi:hypothetical protein [Nocardia sp. alder85J]|uniref:hypothetical protein n=1 Tax=Nocardia sp. alder85J TaxID=2862949 RepID=UPI001CD76FA8|nr:hypothetical protein [Nocardia sp. alder85J]MCX4091071.1 hypothetical protein [Nocardia sp. alder85J]
MSDKAGSNSDRTGKRPVKNPPDATVEIRTIDGNEGLRLARRQTKVFHEIMQWQQERQQWSVPG